MALAGSLVCRRLLQCNPFGLFPIFLLQYCLCSIVIIYSFAISSSGFLSPLVTASLNLIHAGTLRHLGLAHGPGHFSQRRSRPGQVFCAHTQALLERGDHPPQGGAVPETGGSRSWSTAAATAAAALGAVGTGRAGIRGDLIGLGLVEAGVGRLGRDLGDEPGVLSGRGLVLERVASSHHPAGVETVRGPRGRGSENGGDNKK